VLARAVKWKLIRDRSAAGMHGYGYDVMPLFSIHEGLCRRDDVRCASGEHEGAELASQCGRSSSHSFIATARTSRQRHAANANFRHINILSRHQNCAASCRSIDCFNFQQWEI